MKNSFNTQISLNIKRRTLHVERRTIIFLVFILFFSIKAYALNLPIIYDTENITVTIDPTPAIPGQKVKFILFSKVALDKSTLILNNMAIPFTRIQTSDTEEPASGNIYVAELNLPKKFPKGDYPLKIYYRMIDNPKTELLLKNIFIAVAEIGQDKSRKDYFLAQEEKIKELENNLLLQQVSSQNIQARIAELRNNLQALASENERILEEKENLKNEMEIKAYNENILEQSLLQKKN